MKRVICFLMSGLILMMTAHSADALLRKDLDFIRGKVVNVDRKTNEVMIIESKTQEEIVYKVQRNIQLAEKNKMVILSVKKGTKIAETVIIPKR